jgi:hypothetical protein
MWLWGTLLGIVALLAVVVVVVDRRRGPSDNSQGSLDFNVTNRTGAGHDGEWNGPISGSGGGGASG